MDKPAIKAFWEQKVYYIARRVFTLEQIAPLEADFDCIVTPITSKGMDTNIRRKTVLIQMHAGDDAIDPSGPAHPNVRLALRGWHHTLSRSGAASTK